MASYFNRNHAQVVSLFAVVSVSVSTSTSAIAAGVGPFRGLFFRTTTSITITGNNGNTLLLSDVNANTFIWIEGAFCSLLATATAVFALQ